MAMKNGGATYQAHSLRHLEELVGNVSRIKNDHNFFPVPQGCSLCSVVAQTEINSSAEGIDMVIEMLPCWKVCMSVLIGYVMNHVNTHGTIILSLR